MGKIIVFDFNRTLFDPEKGELFPQAEKVLKTLSQKGFSLFLVSRGEDREVLINELGIKKYFKKIVVNKEKTLASFEETIRGEWIELENSYVIGDQVKREITFGNLLGFKTVWLKKGKFAFESSVGVAEKPDFEIKNLEEILDLVL